MLYESSQLIPTTVGPLWEESKHYRDLKDPCPVADERQWHIYGSGGDVRVERWQILHATAASINTEWTEQEPTVLDGLKGEHVAAPGVVYDAEQGCHHMFVQTEFLADNGTVEHLISDNQGKVFTRTDTALHSVAGSHEAALYDPHPAIINGQRYLTYSGSPFIGHAMASSLGIGQWVGTPDLYLAKSVTNTWDGPWERQGLILAHHEVPHHNQIGSGAYEWGLEGSQLVQLEEGLILMNAVCFLPGREFGRRQRIFFAFSTEPTGPYRTVGPILEPGSETGSGRWSSGENGHAAAVIDGSTLALFYQARAVGLQPWRYGIARYDLAELRELGAAVVAGIGRRLPDAVAPTVRLAS